MVLEKEGLAVEDARWTSKRIMRVQQGKKAWLMGLFAWVGDRVEALVSWMLKDTSAPKKY